MLMVSEQQDSNLKTPNELTKIYNNLQSLIRKRRVFDMNFARKVIESEFGMIKCHAFK